MQAAHGLTIKLDRHDDQIFLFMKIHGEVNHQDFEPLLADIEKLIEEAEHPQLDVLVDMIDFAGFDARAAWDDIQFSRKHAKEFHKVAVVGTTTWEKWLTKVGSWFIDGESRYFESMDEARAWLKA
ncbi:STAS/SEC14 domain-containing protein [Gallaecimonas sp. GXIMD4217]|uniref:STAS/SEC14 domain-containing protein n=1 Tax=Gallaecimonas sp. GXIMD4217 TaxID=3131927 RepID=UPI00311B0C40